MNFNNFTIKSQEAVAKATEIATAKQNQAIETSHLLKGMLMVDENVIPYLLKKLNVNLDVFTPALDRIIDAYPKVSGGENFLSNDATKALQRAIALSQESRDEFVSLEHLLLGILSVNDRTSRLLKENGVIEKDLKTAIAQLRKGATVTSQNAEETYNALEKYARNLNDLARTGKLDPVIGRDEEIRRVLQILSRRTKNNPILIGEPGVGKTAIAEGLAHRIIDGDVPENLKTKQIFSLDMGALISRGQVQGGVRGTVKKRGQGGDLRRRGDCPLHRRNPHPGRGRRQRGRNGRSQYPQTCAFTGRTACHWRNDPEGIPEIFREGQGARAAFPAGDGQ